MKAVAGIRAATDPGEIIVSSQDESPRINQIEVPQIRRYTLASLAAAGVAGALGVLRARFQHSHMFTPTRYPEGEWDPARQGLVYRDVWFDSEPGVRLHGWWIEHGAPRATVLYCHGNAGSLGSRVEIFRYFQRLKVNVFAFDYRGYGRSDGRPSEQGVLADARAAHDILISEIEESPERILLFGHSLGGAIAIDCALHRPGAGLVVQSSFTNVREMARARFPGLPLHLVARNHFRSVDKVAKLEMPKLFIHGTADETIPVSLGRRLFEQAAAPKEWYEVPHAGHNDVPLHGGLRYLWKLISFAKRSFRGTRG